MPPPSPPGSRKPRARSKKPSPPPSASRRRIHTRKNGARSRRSNSRRDAMFTTAGRPTSEGQSSITYLEAIRAAQARALADDPRVFIYGQDVGNFGGAFKATKNLAQEFPGRVMDAPISEDAMVGAAIGAAIEGMRPIKIGRASCRERV